LLDGEEVVVDGLLAIRSRFGREKAPTAQTDHFHARIGRLALHGGQITTFESLPPDGDATHAALWELSEALFEAQRLRGDGVDAQTTHDAAWCRGLDDWKKISL
jgi:hypothetical protein